MKVTLERLPESRVQLDIEVEPDRVEKSLDSAYKRFAGSARVPGFRPGKAPRAVVERHIGRDRLMSEALDRLVPDVYNEAIQAEDVDAIAQPELDKVELDPVRLKFIVPVRPTVELGDYRAVRIQREVVELSEDAIAEQMQLVRRRHATQVPVDRPARWDDILIADVRGEADDVPFVHDEDAEFALQEGRVLFVPGLAEAFVGMSKGDERAFEITLPGDFQVERLRGQATTFHLAIKEVKEEILPEEDDELAALVNPDEFPTIEALRERIREDLLKNRQAEADAAYRQQAADLLVEGATLEYPRLLVEREVDHMVQESLGNDRQAYAGYLARIGRSEADYRGTLRESAERRVRLSLVLSKLAIDEGIEVSEEEVEAEIETLSEPLGDEAPRFREMFASDDGRATIRRNLLSRKTLKRLTAIASGQPQEEGE